MKTEARGGSRVALALLGAAALVTAAPAWSAEDQTFISRAAAESYIAHALPAATAANPKYKDPNGDLETQWLTQSVTFGKSREGGIQLHMRELVLKYRGDKVVSKGIHSADFPIDVTGVGLISAAWTQVDLLDAAVGILFKCPNDPCIGTHRDGKASIEQQTDITISDRAMLAKLYSAFRALLQSSGLP